MGPLKILESLKSSLVGHPSSSGMSFVSPEAVTFSLGLSIKAFLTTSLALAPPFTAFSLLPRCSGVKLIFTLKLGCLKK